MIIWSFSGPFPKSNVITSWQRHRNKDFYRLISRIGAGALMFPHSVDGRAAVMYTAEKHESNLYCSRLEDPILSPLSEPQRLTCLIQSAAD